MFVKNLQEVVGEVKKERKEKKQRYKAMQVDIRDDPHNTHACFCLFYRETERDTVTIPV